MNLSRHFTLAELTFSRTAAAERIDNTPGDAERSSLEALCTSVLDPLRDAAGGQAPFTFVDAQRRARARGAVERGIALILKAIMGLRVDGDEEVGGIDRSEHAETGYELGDTGGGGVFAGIGHAARNNSEVQ